MKKSIKFLTSVIGVLALAAASARATLDIPDGNPVGVVSTVATSGYGFISSVTVTLNISGGNNGDLYAWLSYDGVRVSLLDLPGVSPGNPLGDTGSGYDVTLVESGGSGVFDGSQTAGTLNLSGLGEYNDYGRTGTWTLFIADLSGGDTGDSQLISWGVTAVPEPVTEALAVFVLFGAVARLVARRARRKTA
jgi:hypothetical protein